MFTYAFFERQLRFVAVGLICFAHHVMAFTTDMSLPSVTQQVYTSPKDGATSHTILAAYAVGGTPPYDMVIPALSSSSSLRLRILLPPGVSQASIRGESNDWIGTPGNQPVYAVVEGETVASCPVAAGGGVYTCNGQVMEPPSGGLSAFLYFGATLTAPKTVNFVLNNPGAANFSFATLNIDMQVSDVNAYKNWLATAFGSGTTTGTPTTDTPSTGSGGVVTTPSTPSTGGTTSTGNPCSSVANMVSSINADLEITLPRVHFIPGGLGDFSVKLIPVLDPNDSSQIAFEVLVASNLTFLDCAGN